MTLTKNTKSLYLIKHQAAAASLATLFWVLGCIPTPHTTPSTTSNLNTMASPGKVCGASSLQTLQNFRRGVYPLNASSPARQVASALAAAPRIPDMVSRGHVELSLARCNACPKDLTADSILKEAQLLAFRESQTRNVPEASIILHERQTGRLGYNEGAFFQGSDGQLRYVKFYRDVVQVFSEHFANEFYRHLGLNAPNTMVFEYKNSYAYASESLGKVPALSFGGTLPLFQKGLAREFLKGFVADVLLANREIIGGSGNSVLRGRDVYRLDSGSALLMRSSFGRKDQRDLFVLKEWDGFQTINRDYSEVFKAAKLSPDEFCKMVSAQEKTIQNLLQSTGGWQTYLETVVPMFAVTAPEDFNRTVEMLEKRTKAIAVKIKSLGCSNK